MDLISNDSVIALIPVIMLLSLLTAGFKPVLIAVSLYLLWQVSPLAFAVLGALTVLNLAAAVIQPRLHGKGRKYLWIGSAALNAELLIVFCVTASGLLGTRDPMPFGVSYFVFKAIALQTDIYREKYQKPRIDEMLLYLLCFTQITCGPLSRPEHFAHRADITLSRFSAGLMRFMTGVSKKVLLADNLAIVRRNAMLSGSSTALTWLCTVCYSLQLYYDFSGYSDIAVGLTQMLGYDCPENFDHPYMTASVSEFWRRWHMTLGAWFRDYVYIPMGGSRVTKPRLILNLFAVWLLTGLWHGFNLHFLIWAGGYFLLIVFEKLSGFPKKLKSKAAKLLYRIAVLFFINFQWVWFSAEDSSAALTTLRGMLTLHGSHMAAVHLRYILTHDLLLLAAAVLFCFPVVPRLRALAEGKPKLLTVFRVGGAVLVFVMFAAAMGFAASRASNPFAYANF